MKVYIASVYLVANISTASAFTNLDLQKYDGALLQDTYKETATFHKDWRLATLVTQDEYDRQKRNASGNAVIYDVPMGADYNEFKENYRKLLSRHNEFLTENQARDTLRTGLSQTSQDAKVMVATFKITGDDAIWQGKTAYWAHNDTWGRRKLRNGTDYTQSVTVSPATFPAATVLTWSWPNRASPDGVWGYPSIAYGHANGGGIPSPNGKAFTPVQIKNAQAMTATFGWTPGPQGASFDYNVLLETYLTSSPGGQMIAEFGFFLHADPTEAKTDPSHLTYTGPNYVATIVKWPGGFPGVPFIMVILDRSIRSGLFNMLPVVRFLVEKGWLSGEEYFSGMEFGCEPFRGSGSVTIDRLSYDLR